MQPEAARPSTRRWAMVLLGALSLAIAGRVLYDNEGELVIAADAIRRVAPAWLLAAASLEAASYVAYGGAQRRLLAAADVDSIGLGAATATAVAAQAAANCLPGGVAVSLAITYRRFSRRDVDPATCGWMLMLCTVLYTSALAALAIIGVQIAGSSSQSVPDLRIISLVVLAVLAGCAGLLVALSRRRSPVRLPAWASRLWQRHHPSQRGGRGASFLAHLQAARPDPRAVTVALSLLVLSWLLDAGCLALAFSALGGEPPWRGLLLSYCAAQLAATLPFTPGGLGVVEGSLTVALVAFGGSAHAALAAVLLYRLISYWALIPTGLLCYAGLLRAERSLAVRTAVPA